MYQGCPQHRRQPLRDMTELRSGNSDRVPRLVLFGQDHLSAEALILGSQRAEVDTAGATAPLGILPVPGHVVVAGLLLADRGSHHELACDSAPSVALRR
jgi:hypothetical protein